MNANEVRNNEPPPISSRAWWSARRLRYNFGLIAAGIAAFFAYCIVLAIFSDAIPDAEVTIFTILFQGIGYLICMGLANICYFLGPLSERFLHPTDPEAYRRIAFGLGFWFSVALPFSIPALLTFLALVYPQHFQQ